MVNLNLQELRQYLEKIDLMEHTVANSGYSVCQERFQNNIEK